MKNNYSLFLRKNLKTSKQKCSYTPNRVQSKQVKTVGLVIKTKAFMYTL